MATHDPKTGTLEVPGAALYFEVRGQGPVVVLHAAPMDAAAFAPLAELLADRFTVLTTDPRGVHRSTVSDPDRDVSPDERADDVAALIAHVDAGPAQVFGSSGGAVSALALLQRHPALVATVVAHEPPLAELLPERDRVWEETEEIIRTYLAGDRIEAWRLYLASAGITLPEDVFGTVFGTPPQGREAADERFSFEHMEVPTTFWPPDLDALRARRDRLIVGIGEDSAGQLCDRTTRALALALELEPVAFPGDHIGFVHDPNTFADRLSAVLSGAASSTRS